VQDFFTKWNNDGKAWRETYRSRGQLKVQLYGVDVSITIQIGIGDAGVGGALVIIDRQAAVGGGPAVTN
jgi:hypothetical protein